MKANRRKMNVNKRKRDFSLFEKGYVIFDDDKIFIFNL